MTFCHCFDCREKLAQAYNFALDKMGMDIASFPIWNEYIRFLKSADAVGSYAENQKIAWIRKVYQRAVVNPMSNIEQAWCVTTLYAMGTFVNHVCKVFGILDPLSHLMQSICTAFVPSFNMLEPYQDKLPSFSPKVASP